MELTLHDFLIYQLDRELNCHRWKVSDFPDQHGWINNQSKLATEGAEEGEARAV